MLGRQQKPIPQTRTAAQLQGPPPRDQWKQTDAGHALTNLLSYVGAGPLFAHGHLGEAFLVREIIRKLGQSAPVREVLSRLAARPGAVPAAGNIIGRGFGQGTQGGINLLRGGADIANSVLQATQGGDQQ
jgi:hypothetical protein